MRKRHRHPLKTRPGRYWDDKAMPELKKHACRILQRFDRNHTHYVEWEELVAEAWLSEFRYPKDVPTEVKARGMTIHMKRAWIRLRFCRRGGPSFCSLEGVRCQRPAVKAFWAFERIDIWDFIDTHTTSYQAQAIRDLELSPSKREVARIRGTSEVAYHQTLRRVRNRLQGPLAVLCGKAHG